MGVEDGVDSASFVVNFTGKGVSVGVACVSRRSRSSREDRRDHVLELFQFDDCAQLTNLESLLVRLKPASCYHEELDTKANRANGLKRKIGNLLEMLGLPGQDVHRRLFRESADVEFLSGLSDAELASSREAWEELPLALSALGALVEKEGFVTDQDYRGRFELVVGHLDKYMRLDAAAIEALNLFPQSSNTNNANANVREASVLGVLDHCKTKKLGTRLLSRWLRQPLLDVREIHRRQEVVGALKEDHQRRQQVQDALQGVPDLTSLLRCVEDDSGKKGGLRELYQLYLFCQLVPRLSQALKCEDQDCPPNSDLVDFASKLDELCAANCFGKFSELVESVLDMDLAPREFRVKVGHDDSGELAALADKMARIDKKKDRARDELEEGVLSGMNPRFETDPSMLKTYGFHFRINKKYDFDLKKSKQGTYLNVVSACIRWSTDELKSLHEAYMSAYAQFQSKQSVIVKEAVRVASTFVPLFESASSLVAEIDVLASLAHAAAYAGGDSGYVRPSLAPLVSQQPQQQQQQQGEEKEQGETTDRAVRLQDARHPCLEMLDSVDFIANDYCLEPDNSKFQIVTGPNMGGKSVWLRTLGCIMVMAQIGSFVPCSSAKLPVVDAVLARVGASDVQLRGVSTFMAEMVEASAIVQTATENSLVILDELGRGTSTYDGFGLAWAISEHLATKVRPYALFATHFHELTELANLPNVSVKNKHVTALATDDAVTMLYKVNDGPCLESFGINIAQMAGFPQPVLQSAKRKAAQLECGKSKRRKMIQAVEQFAKLDKANLVDILDNKNILTAF